MLLKSSKIIQTNIIFPSVICNGPIASKAGKRKQMRTNANKIPIEKNASLKLMGSNVDQ